jgi:hypothetical protein
MLNPSWARNGGVLSIAADAFLGLRTAGELRHLLRMLAKEKPSRRSLARRSLQSP